MLALTPRIPGLVPQTPQNVCWLTSRDTSRPPTALLSCPALRPRLPFPTPCGAQDRTWGGLPSREAQSLQNASRKARPGVSEEGIRGLR